MKLFTFEDINNMGISLKDCYEWTSQMISRKKDALMPAKISIKPFDGVFCNVMPSMVSEENGLKGALKMVTRYPDCTPALESEIILFDAETGVRLAFMDCTWITAIRTGAVAAHSIILLAKDNFYTIGIIGLGNVSRSTILFLATMLPERKFRIKLLKYKSQEYSFSERFNNFINLNFEYVDSYHDVIKGSDVVISGVTYAPNDFGNDDDFDEGVLVVPIHTLGFTNCDLFFDKVFADDYGHVCHFKNFDKFKSFTEVSDVVNHIKPGRESNSERILAYNIGISVHDTNYAWHIYDLAKQNSELFNSLPDINMKEPNEKFWI